MAETTRFTDVNVRPVVPDSWRAVRHGWVADKRPIWDLFPLSDLRTGGWLIPHFSQVDRWVPCRRVSEAEYIARAQDRSDILIARTVIDVVHGDSWEDYCDDQPWGSPLTQAEAVARVMRPLETRFFHPTTEKE